MRPISLAIALAFAGVSAAHSASIVVTDGGDQGGDGTCTLRQAIDSAYKNAHGSSSCADGSASGNGSDTISFADALVGATITLQGGELSVKSPLTILGSGQIIDANHASRVMYVGFTNLDMSNVSLVNGTAPINNSGGGLFVLQSTVDLDGVSVSGNSADYAAGIAAFNYSNVTLTRSTVSQNTAARKGGGLEVVNGTGVSLVESSITGNTASRGGGAFVSFYADLALDRSVISGNTAISAPPQSGGGIYGYRCGQLSMVDSAIVGNTSNYRGSAIVATECPLQLTNTTVAANTVTATGAAIYLVHGAATIVNATISANTGVDAGGVRAQNASVTLYNTILSGNGVEAQFSAGADLSRYDGATAVARYSLLGTALDTSDFDGATDHNLFSDDPGLGPLQDNGGSTPSMRQQSGSPSIDAGSNALAWIGNHPLSGDQRASGFLRVVNGVVDIGAIEYQPDRIFASSFDTSLP